MSTTRAAAGGGGGEQDSPTQRTQHSTMQQTRQSHHTAHHDTTQHPRKQHNTQQRATAPHTTKHRTKQHGTAGHAHTHGTRAWRLLTRKGGVGVHTKQSWCTGRVSRRSVSDRVHTQQPPQRTQPKINAGRTSQGQPHRGAPSWYDAERAQRPCLGRGQRQAQ